MEQDYTKIAKIMRAFSDPKRLLILDTLSCGERCALELQETLSVAQSTTSYHMKLLEDVGAVAMRSEGKCLFYSLNQQELHKFMHYFAQLITPKPDCVCYTISTESCKNLHKQNL